MKELWKKKSIKIGVLAISAAVVLIIAGITVQGIREKQIIFAHVEAAQKYLSELDYEQAIAEYIAALEIAPNDQALLDALEQAYLEMAQLQVEKEQYSEAIDILDRGYAEIQRIVLLEKKDEVEQLQAQKEEEERLAEEARRLEEEKKKEEEARRAEEEKRREEEVRREEEERLAEVARLADEEKSEEEMQIKEELASQTVKEDIGKTLEKEQTVYDLNAYIGDWEMLSALSKQLGMTDIYNMDIPGYAFKCNGFNWYVMGSQPDDGCWLYNDGCNFLSFKGIVIGMELANAQLILPGLEYGGVDSEGYVYYTCDAITENLVNVHFSIYLDANSKIQKWLAFNLL